ncbi:hypothetical protein M8009_15030, partial [Halomonas sp. ATCH28]
GSNVSFDESLALNVAVTGHQHPDKRPHELPDRLLKSGSDLDEGSVSLAGVAGSSERRPRQRPARKAYST